MYLEKKSSNYLDPILLAVLLATFIHFVVVSLIYADQPPIDEHAFRQSQTAISVYWMNKDGFSIAYETPVLGKPWSIPFEFPIYQIIVAIISSATDLDLNVAGRITSSIFLAACIVPVRGIARMNGISNRFTVIFSTLLFVNPIYLYWGRSFMIETAALFFSLCAAYFFEATYKRGKVLLNIGLLFAFASAAFLQKITTFLPICAVLAAIAAQRELMYVWKTREIRLKKPSLLFIFGFLIPTLIVYRWNEFSDEVKSHNIFGEFLTSSRLSQWNWGTFSQKIDFDVYRLTLLERFTLSEWSAFFLTSLLVTYFVAICRDRKRITLYVIAILLYVLPVVLFTNLHFVHNYYQVANAIFFVILISLIVEHLLSLREFRWLGITSIFALVIFSLSSFYDDYYGFMTQNYRRDSRDYVLGQTVALNTKEGEQFIGFGNDWSSAIPYIAERKALMVPNWFKEASRVLTKPGEFLDSEKVSLVLSCEAPGLSEGALLSFALEREWVLGRVKDCEVAFKPLDSLPNKLERTQCLGQITEVSVETVDRQKVLAVSGWTSMLDSPEHPPGRLYVEVSAGDDTQYSEALRVPAPIVSPDVAAQHDNVIGFSSLIPLTEKQQPTHVSFARRFGDELKVCDFSQSVPN